MIKKCYQTNLKYLLKSQYKCDEKLIPLSQVTIVIIHSKAIHLLDSTYT
jgi:hypothetical protein